jgi:hypothetical protein
MNRELISERDNTQEPPAELWHCRPEAVTIVLLRFEAQRRLDGADTHLACDIRSLEQHPPLEVWREAVSGTFAC